MRVIVLGGTRFVGRALMSLLTTAGDDVMVAHRGEHELTAGAGTVHVHVDRRRLAERRDELAASGGEVEERDRWVFHGGNGQPAPPHLWPTAEDRARAAATALLDDVFAPIAG